MEADAYKLGKLDAAIGFGLEKDAWANLVLPGVGAALAYGLAPRGEEGQAAALGALAGFGGQAALRGAFSPVAKAVAPSKLKLPTPEMFGHAALDEGWSRVKKYMTDPRPKTASLDIGGSIPIPGLGGLGLTYKDQRDRLSGMSRWVPREALERGFDYVDSGASEDEAVDQERSRGGGSSALFGAGLGTLIGHGVFPGQRHGLAPMLLGGLLGAGTGSLVHRLTASDREEMARQAYTGAQIERQRFPIRKHAIQTSNEASPVTLSRGSSAE